VNQHLLVKMRQFGVANLGNSLAKAGPMSGAQPMSAAIALAAANALAVAIALGLTCDRRLELDGPALRHFPCTAE
jgi:hypothetical protein